MCNACQLTVRVVQIPQNVENVYKILILMIMKLTAFKDVKMVITTKETLLRIWIANNAE